MMHTMRFFNDASRIMGHNEIDQSDEEGPMAAKSQNKTERDGGEVSSQFLTSKWNLCYTNGLMNARKFRGKSDGTSFTQKSSV